MKTPTLPLLTLLCSAMFGAAAHSQTNYDESKVPEYALPALLTTEAGPSVKQMGEWQEIRRPELLELLRTQVYGHFPTADVKTQFTVVEEAVGVLDGQAIRKQIRLQFSRKGKVHAATMLIYLPMNSEQPIPLFLGLNFYGNHTIHADANIEIATDWVPNNNRFCISNHQADEVSRGVRAYRWPVERLLQRGYGLATIYCGAIDPDFDDDFQNGIHRLFENEQVDRSSWSTLSAWAWGLSQAMDYLEQDQQIDAQRVAVIGHSRLGKAALWAGATDQRFAMVISNDSGCGGAALSRRRFGETLQDINGNFPHWFSSKFKDYNQREDDLPIDQHQLLALMAPRPLYVASAQDDQWADPKGEYLSLYHAAPVYQLWGMQESLPPQPPVVNSPQSWGVLGYHIRTGPHDITRYDWERYLDFADSQWKND
jgi:dienelactone hydrolase